MTNHKDNKHSESKQRRERESSSIKKPPSNIMLLSGAPCLINTGLSARFFSLSSSLSGRLSIDFATLFINPKS